MHNLDHVMLTAVAISSKSALCAFFLLNWRMKRKSAHTGLQDRWSGSDAAIHQRVLGGDICVRAQRLGIARRLAKLARG